MGGPSVDQITDLNGTAALESEPSEDLTPLATSDIAAPPDDSRDVSEPLTVQPQQSTNGNTTANDDDKHLTTQDSANLSGATGTEANQVRSIPSAEQESEKQQGVDIATTSDEISVAPVARAGRGGKRTSFTPSESVMAGTPSSTTRGRGPGRPRGRGRGGGRGSGRGGRGGKRKREDRDEEDNNSDSSEIYTPTNLMTKSGRSIQKPSSFVPPPAPSPVATSTTKKKRTYRRNPESAVCKICLRGTSPASNMIVFCDGCNTPYHRYCHHPPIDQSVIEEVEKEWFCKNCDREKVEPAPAAELEGFVSAEGASEEERQRYFSSLPPGQLVTLLTRATTLKPDLPLFAPDFKLKLSSTNGHASARSTYPEGTAEEEEYGSEEHPPHYPKPGQGLMKTLPPEQEDIQWLVDDDNSVGVFTHMYQVDPETTKGGASAVAAEAVSGAA